MLGRRVVEVWMFSIVHCDYNVRSKKHVSSDKKQSKADVPTGRNIAKDTFK